MGYAAKHLSESQLEDIARSLFDVKSKQGSELIGLCPVHDDSEPSFSYNTTKDVCHCFSCGFNGDIIKLYSTKQGLDEKEGFKAFCEEFKISDDFEPGQKKKVKKKEIPDLDQAYSMLGDLPQKWVDKLINTRGWSRACIDFLGIKQQTHYQAKKSGDIVQLKNPERIAIPIRDKNHVWNIRIYKPGAKKAKIISWGKAYGEARLFPATPRETGAILLCEGESDTICALSNGFNAITQTSKPKKWSRAHLKEFEGRDVVIAFDADQPGVMYANKYAGPEISKVAKSVRVVEWPDFMGRREDGLFPEDHGQDLTDFFVKHKKTDVDLQRLIDNAPFFVAPDPVINAQALEFYENSASSGRMTFKPRLLAEKILSEFQLLHCPDIGVIYRFNGRYWEEFFEDHLRAIALKMLGNEAKQSMVTDAVFQIKSLATIPHGRQLNDDDNYICVKNGMLNINTLILEDHKPEFYATYELGVTYNPDSKDNCDRFLKFLDETVQTPAVIAQIQEFFGYCFLRKSPFAKCLLLLGPGSDGKSLLLTLLREMVGPENCASVSFNEMEDQFLRSSLYQKTVNISTEVGSKAIESPYFKAITAGDPINAAFKHKNTFSFIPYCKLIFAANKLPRVLDNSDGFYRRILPISFKRQFLEGSPDTDPFLEEKLLAEKSEVFHWALVGLKRLLKNKKFTNCQETIDLLMDYKRLNNPVICFAEDCCEMKEGYTIPKKAVFEKYEGYCRANNYRAYSRENFFRELYAAFSSLKSTRPRKDNPKREPYLKGITIMEAEE